jgi:phenylalanyl-tRNA synthetase beta chain
LLEAVQRNENAGTLGAKLFESGSTFWADGSGTIDEKRRVGLVGSSDLREVRGVVEEVLVRLDARREIRVVPDARAGYAGGACGRVEWGGQVVGHLGKVERKVAEKLSLRELPCAAELDLDPLLSNARLVPTLQPLAKFPPVQRDVSLVVSEGVRYEALEGLIGRLKLSYLENVEYVTTYRGKPLEKGQKSVTTKLVFRAPDRTLTGEEVEAAVKQLVDAAGQELKATLRA